jgi:putative peptide zinc metalloprotease protein
VIVNLNPLVPLDGYYALSDWLEVSNLRQRAFAHLTWVVKSRWLGLDHPEPPTDERERRIFVLYGTLAAGYTGFIFLVLGLVAYGWMSHTFGVMGVALLVLVAWLTTGRMRRTLWRTAADAWRERRAGLALRGKMRRARYGLGAAALCAVMGGFVPWPITVTGPFVVSPARSGVIVAPDSGIVFEVLVREADRIGAGAPVALIRNLGLERDLAASARTVDSLGIRESQARAGGREGEAARIAAQARAEGSRLAGIRNRIRALAIRAPAEGIVESPRPDTLVGRMVSLGDTLLRVAGASGLEARIGLGGAGASLAHPGQRARLISHADPGFRVEATVSSVAASASPGGGVESRVRLSGSETLRPGMTGEARITLRQSNAWGALWWAVRSRIRTDILL